MRILVVEDEKRLATFIRKGLEEQSYAVDLAFDGERGEFLALTNDYDLIVLDLLLPIQDGWKTCEKIRKDDQNVPIIMLTAMDGVADMVKGLDYGADDYITKPFAFEEFLARVRAQLRRRYEYSGKVLHAGNIQLDTHTRKVSKDGQVIDLTNKEFALLEYLMLNKGRVVTRTQITEHVWDMQFDPGSNVIDVMINYLRKKIESKGGPRVINTVRGVGYMIKK